MTGLRHKFSAVESESGDLAFRVDLQIIVTAFELLGPQIDLDQIVGQASFQKRDMGESEQAPGA